MSVQKYELLGRLGGGGFGTVFLARKHPLGTLVAIKVLNHEVDERVRDQLWDEALLCAAVHHPNIVAVDDLVELPDGRLGLVTEYVEGEDLARLLGEAQLPLGCVLEVVGEVGSALAAAWNALGPDGTPLRIVHRDIKPENIRIGRNGEVKLLDFGIARGNLPRAGKTWQLAGTLRYMAPERYRLESPHQSDVFSLGCVLWRGALGEGFFPAEWSSEEPFVECARAPQQLEALLSRLAQRDLAPGLEALLRQSLAWSFQARPDAQQFSERCAELGQALAHPLSLREWCWQRWPPSSPRAELAGSLRESDLRASFVGSRSDSLRSGIAQSLIDPHTRRVSTVPVPVEERPRRAVPQQVFFGGAALLLGGGALGMLGLLAGGTGPLLRTGCVWGLRSLCLAPVQGQIVHAVTRGPVRGLQGVWALAGEDGACAVQAAVDERGAFRLDGLCPATDYRLALDHDGPWLLEPAGVRAGEVRAWPAPPAPGLYILRGEEMAAVGSWVEVREGVQFDPLRGLPGPRPRHALFFPARMLPQVPVLLPEELLVSVGEAPELAPLVQRAATWLEGEDGLPLRLGPWALVGQQLVDGHIEPVRATVDPEGLHRIESEQGPVYYLEGRALLGGRYLSSSRVLDVGAAQPWGLGEAPVLTPSSMDAYWGLDKLLGPHEIFHGGGP